MTPAELKHQIAVTALNDMMRRGHLNICLIDTIATSLGISAKGEAYDTLRPLHCVDFARMPKEVADAIPGLIQQILDVAPTYQFDMPPAAPVLEVPKVQQRTTNMLGFRSLGFRK